MAHHTWDWSIERSGEYLAIISIAIAPVHAFIIYTSKWIEDRQFITAAQILCIIGCIFVIDYGNQNEWQYVIGTTLINIGANMIDGVSTSLVSKVIPKYIQAGIWNAGLLVTIVGSFGRAVGGGVVGIAGLGGVHDFENNLFIPALSVCMGTFGVTAFGYKKLKSIR